MKFLIGVGQTPETEAGLLGPGLDGAPGRGVTEELVPEVGALISFIPHERQAPGRLILGGYVSYPSYVSPQLVARWLWSKLASRKGDPMSIAGRTIHLESEKQLAEVIFKVCS